MSLREVMADDATRILTTEEFAETLVYRPHGKLARTIEAIVEYGAESTIPHAQSIAPVIQITVKNSSTQGIPVYLTPDQGGFDKGKDKIDIPLRDGGTPETRGFVAIVPGRQDSAMVTLEVR